MKIESSILDIFGNNTIGLFDYLKDKQNNLCNRLKLNSSINKFNFNHKKVNLIKLNNLYPYVNEVLQLKENNINIINNKQKKIVQDFVNDMSVFFDGGYK